MFCSVCSVFSPLDVCFLTCFAIGLFVVCNAIICSAAVWNHSLVQADDAQTCMQSLNEVTMLPNFQLQCKSISISYSWAPLVLLLSCQCECLGSFVFPDTDDESYVASLQTCFVVTHSRRECGLSVHG